MQDKAKYVIYEDRVLKISEGGALIEISQRLSFDILDNDHPVIKEFKQNKDIINRLLYIN